MPKSSMTLSLIAEIFKHLSLVREDMTAIEAQTTEPKASRLLRLDSPRDFARPLMNSRLKSSATFFALQIEFLSAARDNLDMA